MALTTALIEVLKRELKSRDITYADVAKKLDLSEASIKRMFSKDFMLSRLDEICEFAGIEFADLARAGEALVFASGRLSPAASTQLADRLKRTVQEFRDAHHEDLKLPLDKRPVMSILLALRQWELGAFRDLRRKTGKT